ncbi:hypothetical protein [Sinorhizobium chiapasense]|uniref:DUF1161 domain-containing protein n=1 Tax=Sinorhizobium chiapasense TaxID=501572 RepID=A0ABZ2BDR3_9HYPH
MMLVYRALSAALAVSACVSIVSATEAQENADITVIAAQIRSQGYACINPTSAEPVAAESRPDEPVYVLLCENATYKVHLVPDQAAKVKQIK